MGQAVVPASVLNITPGQSAPSKSLVLDPTGNNDLVTQFLLAHSLPKDIYAAALPLASGTATGGSTTTLVDSGKSWTTNAWAGYRVKITAGAAAGSYIVIASNTGNTLTFEHAAANAISAADTYVIYGPEINVYWRNCFRPRQSRGNFDCLLRDTTLGELLNERWRYVAADADVASGNTFDDAATIDVFNGGSKVFSKDVIIHVAKSTAKPPFPELLSNPGFESALLPGVGDGGWWLGSVGELDAVVKRSGNASIKLPGSWATALQRISLVSSTQYTFNVYSRKTTQGGGCKISFKDPSNNYLQTDGTTWNATLAWPIDCTADTADTWVLHTLTFTTPAWGSSTSVLVTLNNQGTSPTWNFDDASLKKTSGKTTRSILFIGDSTGIAPLAEVVRLFGLDTSMGVTLKGPVDAGGGVLHACYGGLPWSGLYQESANWNHPFSTGVGGLFDLSQWAGYTGLVAGDWIMIHLGINDAASQSDTGMATFLTTIKTHIDYILADILATIPGIRIGLQLPIPSADADGWAANYGMSLSAVRGGDAIARLREFMQATYGTAAMIAQGVHIVPYHCNFDSLNNMIFASQATFPNARNRTDALKTTRRANGVHPAAEGYLQMADSVYSFLKYMQ